MTTGDFTVVVNNLGQHSLWRTRVKVPPGWRRRSAVMTESECLAEIERSWRDMAPADLGTWDGPHGRAEGGQSRWGCRNVDVTATLGLNFTAQVIPAKA